MQRVTQPRSLLTYRSAKDEDDYAFGRLTLSAEDVRSIFQPSLSKIEALIDEQVAELASHGGITCLFLVGGYAASPLLMKAVQSRYGNTIPYIRKPTSPGSAVLEGAVLYGLMPAAVATQRARRTYGVAISQRWSPRLHDGRGFVKQTFQTAPGIFQPFAVGMFDPFVVSGEEIPVSRIVTRTYSPPEYNDKSVSVRVYSAEGVPETIQDESAVPECIATVAMPAWANSGAGREVNVSFAFGEAELRVAQSCKATGEHMFNLSQARDGNGLTLRLRR